ncbi:MAG: PDC sensor domain-containing protein [Thiomargarita sp.]|nr:PDC sensor domain-containing protein [Thiomargarita sp.]
MTDMLQKKRAALIALFEPAMLNLSKESTLSWSNLEHLDTVLKTHFTSVPYCQLMYAVNEYDMQISSNITASSIESSYCHQDLSQRPYSIRFTASSKRHFLLSPVYINLKTGGPCISALQPVIDHSQHFLGFIIADFDYHRLPISINTRNTPVLHYTCPKNYQNSNVS